MKISPLQELNLMKPNSAWIVEASTLSSGASNGRHWFQRVRSEQCKIFLAFNHFSRSRFKPNFGRSFAHRLAQTQTARHLVRIVSHAMAKKKVADLFVDTLAGADESNFR
jgi:hypothetical protein